MIVIIDYKAGNTKSVLNAVERLGYEAIISSDPKKIKKADKVVFPGVGAAAPAMENLKRSGLDQLIPQLKQPVLGICLGMQLLCDYTEEGEVQGLGVFKTSVRKFPNTELVPQMGWNNLDSVESQLMKGIEVNADFYFVHSYYADLCFDSKAICNYSVPFSAILEKDNFYATQFHPEKSGEEGMNMIKNFLAL